MKTKTISFLLLIACYSFSVATAQEQETSSQSIITASEYCAFLNAKAAENDSDHFYDGKMSLELESAVLWRLGKPGSYHYETINGKGNIPINFISYSNALAYASWKKLSLSACYSDHELCSNCGTFLIRNRGLLQETTSQEKEKELLWVGYGFGGTLVVIAAIAAGYYCCYPSERSVVEDGVADENGGIIPNGAEAHLENGEGITNGSEDPVGGLVQRQHLITLPTRAVRQNSISSSSLHEWYNELESHSPRASETKSDAIVIPTRLFSDYEQEEIEVFMSDLLSSHQTYIAEQTKEADALWKVVRKIRTTLKEKKKDHQLQCDNFEKIIEELLVGAKVTSHYTTATSTGKQSSYAELANKAAGDIISNLKSLASTGVTWVAKKAIDSHAPGMGNVVVELAKSGIEATAAAGEKYATDLIAPSEESIIEEVLSQITSFLEQQGFKDKNNVAERAGSLKGEMSNFLSHYNTSLKQKLKDTYLELKKTYDELEKTQKLLEDKEKDADDQERNLRKKLKNTSFFKEYIQTAKRNWGEYRDSFTIIRSKWGAREIEIKDEVIQKNEKAEKALNRFKDNKNKLTKTKEELEKLNQQSMDNPEDDLAKREARLALRDQEETNQFFYYEYQRIKSASTRTSILFETYTKAWKNGWLWAWPNELDTKYPTSTDIPFGSLSADQLDQSLEQFANSRQEELVLHSKPTSRETIEKYSMLFEDLYKTGSSQPEHIELTMDSLDDDLQAQEKKIRDFKRTNRSEIRNNDPEIIAILSDYESDAIWLKAEKAEVKLLLRHQDSSSNEVVTDLMNFSLVQQAGILWQKAARAKRETIAAIEALSEDAALRHELPIIKIEQSWAEAESHRLYVESSPNNLIYFLPLEDYRHIFNFKKEIIPSLEKKKECITATKKAWENFIRFYNDNRSAIDQLDPKEKMAWEGRLQRAERYLKLDELRISYLEYRLAFENLTSSSGGGSLQSTWDHLMSTYENTRDALPENRRKLVKASLQLLPFLLEAKKEEMLETRAETAALTLKAEDEKLFEWAWDQAISKINDVVRAYEYLVQIQDQFKNELTEEQKSIWDQSLSEAKYNQVLYTIREHVLQAEKSVKIAKLAHGKAMSLNPKDCKFDVLSLDINPPGAGMHALPSLYTTPSANALLIIVRKDSPNSPDEDFDKLWYKAIATAWEACKNFEAVVEHYTKLREKVPSDYHAKWDRDLRAAQCGVVHYQLDLAWLRAIKTGDKVTDVKRDNAFSFNARASAGQNSQSIWQEAASASEEAVEQCKNLLEVYQKSHKKFKEILSQDGILLSQNEEYPQLEEIGLWLEEEKGNHAVVAAYAKALQLDYNDGGFESAWKMVGEAATGAKQSVQAILSYFENLHDDTKYNPNDMIKYRYWISFYEAIPHLIAAELADKQAVSTWAKVQEMLPRFAYNACFSFLQKEATQQAADAASAWKKYASILSGYQIPQERKKAWINHVDKANDQMTYWEKQVEDSQQDRSLTRQMIKIKSGDVDYWKQRINGHNDLIISDYEQEDFDGAPRKMELTGEDLFHLSRVLGKNGSNEEPAIQESDKKEAEAAFEKARNRQVAVRATEKNYTWEEAAAEAQAIVEGCDGRIDSTLTGLTSLEEVKALPKEIINQREYWMQKKLIADVRHLASAPVDRKWKRKRNKSNEIIESVRGSIWTLASEGIKSLDKGYDHALVQSIKDLLLADSLAVVSAFDSITDVAAVPVSSESLSIESDHAYVVISSYVYAHAYIAAISAKAVIMEEADFVIKNALKDLTTIVTTKGSALDQKDKSTHDNIQWAQDAAGRIAKFIGLILSYQKSNLGDQISTEYDAAAAAYVHAAQEKNRSSWKEASASVKAIAGDWKAMFQEIGNSRSLEKFLKWVKCQEVNWFYKVQIANFMSEIETPHIGNGEGINESRSARIMLGIKERVWPSLEQSFNDFINASKLNSQIKPTKSQMIAAGKAAFIYATIIPTLYTSVFSRDFASASAHAYASACAYVYAYAAGSALHMIDAKEAAWATEQSANAAICIAKGWRHIDSSNTQDRNMKNENGVWFVAASEKAVELAKAFIAYKEPVAF